MRSSQTGHFAPGEHRPRSDNCKQDKVGGVKPESHNSRFNHADRSEPDCLAYLKCREQAESLSDCSPSVRICALRQASSSTGRSILDSRLASASAATSTTAERVLEFKAMTLNLAVR